MIKKNLIIIISGIFLIFCLYCRELYPQELGNEKLNRVMNQYGYASWGTETGKAISGVKISEETLFELSNIKMRKVWKKANISTGKIEELPYSIIRQGWKSKEEDSNVDITMVVCTTFEAAKKLLITRYANTQMGKIAVKTSGHKLGIDIGNVCFVSGTNQDVELSTIDFIRNNVLIMIRAEGSIRGELETLARELDNRLIKKSPANKYFQLKEIPTIIHFSSEKAQVRLGDSIRLYMEIKNQEQSELRYFWQMSGGGVEKDSQGNFVYYAGEPGKHTITVTAVNELGLQHSKSLEIEVVQ